MTQMVDLGKYVSNAVEVVEFKLVREQCDLEDDSLIFHPEMAHQIFGENEKIFGFSNLKVHLYYTAGPLNIYFDYKFSKKVECLNQEEIKTNDIESEISEILPDGHYYTSLDEFAKAIVKNERFKPVGEKLIEFECHKGTTRTFEIYKCDLNTPNFKQYFLRLQSFILWFADAANYIDVDDLQWMYFIVYEKYKNSSGNDMYASVGYATVYQYYAYPEHIRPSLSQILILPPFQKMGIGTKFIETIYQCFLKDSRILDLTVEDPSEEFTRIRNYIDVKLCQNLPSFAPNKLRLGFNQDMIIEARKKAKINKRQARIVYEILRFKNTNINNEKEFQAYRLDVKKRLNLVFFRQKSDIEKVKLKGVEVTAAQAMLPTVEERIVQLRLEFKDVVNDYKHILERIAND